jgi:chemotaxis methyl-accepting protein methylase
MRIVEQSIGPRKKALMEDTQFRQLLNRFGFSWTGYRKVRKGVKKRLARRMHAIHCRNIEEYIAAIQGDREEWLQFESLMTVSISRFFRDRKLWEILRESMLPFLALKKSPVINVWSAGCASGEEIYSFKILWQDLRKSFSALPEIYMLATDMNPEYLDRARTAVYPRSSLREVPTVIRNIYFKEIGRGRYALRPGMKDEIVWQTHHLLSDPPEIEFDIIFLRNNLLTYYVNALKIPAVSRIVKRLADGGFLIIGSHESIPVELTELMPWKESTLVFQKQI